MIANRVTYPERIPILPYIDVLRDGVPQDRRLVEILAESYLGCKPDGATHDKENSVTITLCGDGNSTIPAMRFVSSSGSLLDPVRIT